MPDAEWDRTEKMLERKEKDGDIEWLNGEPHYQGRHIIREDSDVDGGVYLGRGKREAIVVDSKKYDEVDRMYEKAKNKARDSSGKVNKHPALNAAYRVAVEEFSPSDNEIDRLVERYGNLEDQGIESVEDMRDEAYLACKIAEHHGVENDGKIALDVFSSEGVGVCRHRALAAGAIIEKFQEDGILTGEVSIDRNSIGKYGHAWVRYENSGGDVFVIDPTQEKIKSLEETEDDFWDYGRPEDDI